MLAGIPMPMHSFLVIQSIHCLQYSTGLEVGSQLDHCDPTSIIVIMDTEVHIKYHYRTLTVAADSIPLTLDEESSIALTEEGVPTCRLVLCAPLFP